MDNAGPPITNSTTPQVYASDGTIVGRVPEPSASALPAHATVPPSLSVSADGTPSEPVKRRPGRPKGSSKKNLLGTPTKIKRPVGRPRKDGFPAGSVGPNRPKPKRDSTTWPQGASGVGYPPMNVFMGEALAPPSVTFQIDPSLEKDDWAELARERPSSFISTLLGALAAPNPVSSAGPTVEEAFKSHLVSLTPNPQQLQPIPSLYSILKTFWLPSSPAYFALTASASTARTPSEHRFLYWDPQPLVFNGISCPACSQSLTNKGRISSGPIKIYDIEKPFFIIGCEYVCKGSQCCASAGAEGRKFASTDPSILRSLPARLQDEFPARLMYGDTDSGTGPNIWNWKALGISRSLWNMVRACLKTGMRKDTILHLIYSIQRGTTEDGAPLMGVPVENTARSGVVNNGETGAVETDMHQDQDEEASPDTTDNQTFSDAFNNAWKENTAVTESNGNKASVPGSTSMVAPTILPHSTPGPSGHPYPSPASYPSYPPYPPYPFFPATLVNAGGMPPTNNSISAPPPNSQFPQESGETDTPSHNKRSPRHCCKCGSQDCKGKGGRNFCQSPCQDCGKLECKGRNSRRPDKKCSEGWV